MTENEVQQDVVQALELMSWEVTTFSIPRKAFIQLSGVPDIYATHEGKQKQVWIEVKRPGKGIEPGSKQERWLTRTAASGALCIVVHSVDELLEKLTETECM